MLKSFKLFLKRTNLIFLLCFSVNSIHSQVEYSYALKQFTKPYHNKNQDYNASYSKNTFFFDTLDFFGRYAYTTSIYTTFALTGHILIELNSNQRPFSNWKLEHLENSITQLPIWDYDHWFYNYGVHGYMGYISYTTYRNRGGSRFGALGCATLNIVYYEYMIGGWTQPPSYNDIIITTFFGSVIGELSLYFRDRVANYNNGYLNLWQKLLIFMLDPIEVVNRKFKFNSFSSINKNLTK